MSEVSKELLKEMNEAYDRLDKRYNELAYALLHRTFMLRPGWFNGHYQKQEDGSFQRDSYPIPVIGVKDVCDVEIHFHNIEVATKLKREKALAYSFDKLSEYSFEAYGIEDFLSDYYHEGQTIEELREHLLECEEEEIGFSFMLPFTVEGEKLFEFVKLLRREGFYY